MQFVGPKKTDRHVVYVKKLFIFWVQTQNAEIKCLEIGTQFLTIFLQSNFFDEQCDQKGRLFFQYLAIYNKEY